MVGRRQEIEIGPMSGQSNVVYWLQERGIEPRAELVQALFERGKSSPVYPRRKRDPRPLPRARRHDLIGRRSAAPQTGDRIFLTIGCRTRSQIAASAATAKRRRGNTGSPGNGSAIPSQISGRWSR